MIIIICNLEVNQSMAENKWILNGFSFNSKDAFLQAKKEDEAIDYLKKNSDLTNGKHALKVYNKLIDKDTFHTMVGYFFLEELRRIIIINNVAEKSELKNIQIIDSQNENIGSAYAKLQLDKELQYQKENYRKMVIARRNSRIINLFLVVVIIAMFVISIFVKNSEYKKYENTVIDKNATWAEELQQKEDALNAREDQLNQEGNK